MNNKRGLSTIVSTLIIILLVLVAVGIVWGVTSNILKKGADDISLNQFFIDLELERAYLDAEGNVIVNVKRNAGEGDMVGMNFVFSDGTQSEVQSVDLALSELEEITLPFTLENLNSSEIISVSVAPIFASGETGAQSTSGDITDYVEIGDGIGPGVSGGGDEDPAECTPGEDVCSGFSCGTAVNGTCGTVSCGTCTGDDVCNASNACVAPEACTDTCSSLGYECGIQTVCGNETDCSLEVGLGCDTLYANLSYSCNASGLCQEPLAANLTGVVGLTWPPGVSTYFDSTNFTVDVSYINHWVLMTSGSANSSCYLIYDYIFPIEPETYNQSHVRLAVTESTGISTGDNFDVWLDFDACSAASVLL